MEKRKASVKFTSAGCLFNSPASQVAHSCSCSSSFKMTTLMKMLQVKWFFTLYVYRLSNPGVYANINKYQNTHTHEHTQTQSPINGWDGKMVHKDSVPKECQSWHCPFLLRKEEWLLVGHRMYQKSLQVLRYMEAYKLLKGKRFCTVAWIISSV